MWYPRCPEKKIRTSPGSTPRSEYTISRSFSVSSFASWRHFSQSQVCSSIRSFLHLGQGLGEDPSPVAPQLLHFQLSWVDLQGVLRWSASMSKTRSAPFQPFSSIGKVGSW